MTELRTLLHEHAVAPRAGLDVEALLQRARRRRWRTRLVAWLAALAAVGAVAFPAEQVLVPASHSPSESVRTVNPRPGITTTTIGSPGPGPVARPPGAARSPGPPPVPTTQSAAPSSPANPASTTTPAAADVPVAPVPLRPGQYTYAYHESGNTSGQAPLVVDAPTATSDGQVQHERYSFNIGGGYAATIDWTILYNNAGMHQQHYTMDETFNGAPYDHKDCSDPPDALTLPTGVHKGDSWQFSATCTDRLNGTSTSTVRMVDNGLEQVMVGAQLVWTVHITQNWYPGDTEDVWDLPANGLWVQDQVYDTSSGSTYAYSAKVQNASPS